MNIVLLSAIEGDVIAPADQFGEADGEFFLDNHQRVFLVELTTIISIQPMTTGSLFRNPQRHGTIIVESMMKCVRSA